MGKADTASGGTNTHALPAALAGDIRAIVTRFKRRLREQGTVGDFTPSQVAVLLRLERDGPSTVSSLARAEGMRPQSMGTTIAPLEAAGLVAGAPDPNDGRQTLLSLTDACRTYLRENRAARQDWLCRTIQAKLTADEQQHLAGALRLLERIAAD
ncbi:MarR family winged helix-turn-helix transcriptional regulator [Trinickia dinghuensis]|uniref:MarR family transcriptional regulator n=1 Tax=Trinickia dinghuensis TaxID=2291023 RepID=A0A3D8JYB0_9BURK|nr:MarR family transcriptional regulator [Trinickia dinghuensis]RDU97636.1 MarR family transcriptional regulator [Trinickia dinghuensis]